MSNPSSVAVAASGAEAPVNTGEKRGGFRWIVLAIVSLTYLLGAADRANLAVALPFIKRDFNLTNAEAGAAASVFFIGVTLIQIPGGLLIQKVRVRMVMIGATLLTSLATLFSGLSGTSTQLLLSRTMLGFAEGPLVVGGLSMINRWFPPRERATAIGIYIASFKAAPAIVPLIAAAIIYKFGWREVFYFFAAPGLVVAALWYFSSDNPRHSRANEAEVRYIESAIEKTGVGVAGPSIQRPQLDWLLRARHAELLGTRRQVLSSFNLWGCGFAYCMMGILTYAILTWVPTYLVEVKKYTLLQMGVVASMPWIGAVLGSLVGGLLSDRVFGERRKPVMLIAAASSIFTMYGLVHAPNDPIALGGLMLATGFLLNLGYSTFSVYPMGLVEKAQAPLAIAIVTTCGALGSGVGPVIVGFIVDRSDWNTAFMFLVVCSLVSLLLVGSIIEARPQPARA